MERFELGYTRFAWPEKKFDFEIDERFDPDLFELGTSALGFLDESLVGLRLKDDDPDRASKILCIYFAARIYGATAAALMLLAHRLGREAVMAGRTQYECFVKMIYYDHFHAAADDLLENLKVFNFKFGKRLGVDPTTVFDPEELAALEALAKKADINFKNHIFDVLERDPEFAKAADEGNPFARWFLNNSKASYGYHYVYGSSLVHATPVDLQRVVVSQEPGAYMINVDSRLKAVNVVAVDIIQRCFSAAGVIRWRFGLGFSDQHIAWSGRFGNVAKRHEGETFDLGSMHD